MEVGIQMKRYLEEVKEVRTEDNKSLHLEYYLIESVYYEKGIAKTAYGVEIMNRANRYIESEVIEKITNSKDKIYEILNKLITNAVTPTSMVYAVDELF